MKGKETQEHGYYSLQAKIFDWKFRCIKGMDYRAKLVILWKSRRQ